MNKGSLLLIFCITLCIPTNIYSAENDIIINELYYHPPSDTGTEEYIELFNKGSEPVDISGWGFGDGVYYIFPDETIIPAGEYILVANNKDLVAEIAPETTVLGNYEGNLRDSDERIELINSRGDIIESIHYYDRNPWPEIPDGQGASLERISSLEPADSPSNWRSGLVFNGNDWLYVQVSGILETEEIKFHLTNNARIRIDEISLINTSDLEDVINNNGFEGSLSSSWEVIGSHEDSERFLYSDALVGNYVYQLTSDSSANTIDQDYVKFTDNDIEEGEIYHLSFWMQISNGVGDLIIDAGENFTEIIPLRSQEISPGRQNFSYSENLPPYISETSWTPHSPSPSESVQIQAHIEDRDGVEGVFVEYQAGLEGDFGAFQKESMELKNNGSENAGTWVATLPDQRHLTLVRFRIIAIDQQGNSRVYPDSREGKRTETYIHYNDSESSEIPIMHFFTPEGFDRSDQIRGKSIMMVRPPDEPRWDVYDHIMIETRESGYNVFLLKHHEYDEMSSLNVIYETKTVDRISDSRYALAEWLSYQIHQSIGTVVGKINHVRLFYNGDPRGFYLMFEQPNKNMIARHGIDNSGNLYKIIWNIDRSTSRSNIIRQHERKTNERTNQYDDVVEMIQTLHSLDGQAQKVYIETNFAVDEIISYFVGCQLTSDWDGYFNNHFVYHDYNTSGLWYIFPWDKDKTFGDSDAYQSILPYYDWYDFPILYGADGTPESGKNHNTWWRPPGFISEQFLANKDIQERYLHQLGYVTATEFTEEKWFPVIDELEERMEPEIRYRAALHRQNVSEHLELFHNNIESFRRQITKRRQFILSEVEQLIGPVSVNHWQLY